MKVSASCRRQRFYKDTSLKESICQLMPQFLNWTCNPLKRYYMRNVLMGFEILVTSW